MKLLMIILLSTLSFIAKSSPVDRIAQPVLESFNSTYKNATEVKWVEGKEFFKAEFQLEGKYLTAFFTPDGQQIAVARNLSFDELPQQLKTTLKGTQNNHWISALFELSNERGTSYFAVLENAGSRIVLQSSNNDWSTFLKDEKL